MTKQTIKETYISRIKAMVANGKTIDEAKAVIRAELNRSYNAATARAMVGYTGRASTIGEILAAKAR